MSEQRPFVPPELTISPWDLFEPASSEKHERADAVLGAVREELGRRGVKLDAYVADMVANKDLWEGLSERLRDPATLANYAEHTSRFFDNGHSRKFYGASMKISGSHADGREREDDEGERLDLDVVRQAGIDPSCVLVFRLTQPSETPKPEAYWTTDYFETQRGLNVEVPAKQRRTATILVSDLATIAGADGLIRDINDDNGVAVRRISNEPFDQRNAIGRVRLAQ